MAAMCGERGAGGCADQPMAVHSRCRAPPKCNATQVLVSWRQPHAGLRCCHIAAANTAECRSVQVLAQLPAVAAAHKHYAAAAAIKNKFCLVSCTACLMSLALVASNISGVTSFASSPGPSFTHCTRNLSLQSAAAGGQE